MSRGLEYIEDYVEFLVRQMFSDHMTFYLLYFFDPR